jgi:ribose transport system substrate-binding protein
MRASKAAPVLGLVMACVLGAVACSSSGSAAGSSAAGSSTTGSSSTSNSTPPLAGKRLCVSSPVSVQLLTQGWEDLATAAKQSGNGLTISVTNANGNTSLQLSQAEQMVNENCAAIMAVPLDGDGWEAVVTAAKAKGIPFFNHSSEIITGATQFVAINHYAAGEAVGKLAGAWLKANQPTKAVGVIEDPGSGGLQERALGFIAGVKAADPSATIYTAGNTGADTPSGATTGSNLLVAHPTIRVLFGYNDPIGLGAYEAATQAGYKSPSDFFVASVDGTAQVLQKIEAGTIYQAAASFWYRYTFPALERDIERYLLGQKIPPTAIITANIVTKSNAAVALQKLNNPFSPANAGVWCTVIGYSQVPVATGQNLPPVTENGCRSAVIPKKQ